MTSAFRGARYLVRFDDLCPTMDWSIWNELEAALIDCGVAPILAVVPDNRDPKLQVDPPAADFWERVRGWQARGWTIALHGFQHVYVTGESGLLGMNRRSEFAGLGYPEQLQKLRSGLAIFAREGVRAEAWIAPAHSFDATTLEALAALGLRVISDGMAWSPFLDPAGNAWVPQQFARMRPMPCGVWTFCYHANHMSPDAVRTFKRQLARLAPRMIPMGVALGLATRPYSAFDRVIGLMRSTVSALRRR